MDNDFSKKFLNKVDPIIHTVIDVMLWPLLVVLVFLPFAIIGALLDSHFSSAILYSIIWVLSGTTARLIVWHKEYKEMYGVLRDYTSDSVVAEEPKKSDNVSSWNAPSTNLLTSNKNSKKFVEAKDSKQAEVIKKTVRKFGCPANLKSIDTAPQLITYHFKPEVGESVKDQDKLERAIAQTLDIPSVAVIIDEDLNGLFHVEVARADREVIQLRDVLESKEFVESSATLPFVVGIDTAGKAVVEDLRKMPHLLFAGQTGSGKSLFTETILLSLLYTCSPNDLKLILVDPKMVQLAPYNDIPHLLYPVITDPVECKKAVKWLVGEMENRFHTLAETRTRNIEEYNQTRNERMPYIVLLIDEFADLMMIDPENYEAMLVRLMQKSRAVGIHIVYGTSRPSVDVITGLLKANTPARVAFTTASEIDSRAVIDQKGAEKLLAKGDLYFASAETWPPIRAQGVYVSDSDVMNVTDSLRS